ncbi:type IV secretory pathway, VirD4 component [Gloeobacter kilaueensis]|uniref:Type IV secretory pathway, VirD4 component n=1 Tax=Gloeobacter kilaueensis (strain ATCC BAA-2537 / CCAP 1431/1 / ULC 316 / JS1) TaxID=1183438 RepID=U5QK05_GLOK1|nr:type IV secretory pathway, VirD4 component [Gloeobacter kilaueensis]AGY57939.1 type IV secretory pathway, VirD4 component [Gloeobacter kilaueensis JS1]
MLQSLWNPHIVPSHGLFLGATGVGKTARAAQEAFKLIDMGYGLAFLSPTPEVIDDILVRLSPEALARTHLINPCNPDYAVGINILEVCNPGLCEEDAIAFTAGFLLDAIRDAFGPEALQARSGGILKEILGLMLTAGRHPAEAYLAWDPGDEGRTYRQSLYAQCNHGNPFYQAYLQRVIDALPTPRDRHAMLEASLNKIKLLFDHPAITCTLLHPQPSFDLQQIIDQNEILLVDLSSAYLGRDGVQILGGFLLSAIYMAALRLNALASRNDKFWPVFADEFHEYTTDTLMLGLAEARKLGVLFQLICQDKGIIERRMPETFDSILGNVDRLYVFRCSDERTRTAVVDQLFGYNPKWKDSIGDWKAQKECHAATIGALQRGEYFFQDKTLWEEVGTEEIKLRYLKARLERTSGNGTKVKLPLLREPERDIQQVAMQTRILLAARDAQGVYRREIYQRIRHLYQEASNQVQQLRSRPQPPGHTAESDDTPLPR